MSKTWPIAAAKLRALFHSSDRDRGDAARDKGDWLAAVEAYQAHLEEHPKDGAIWVQLGHASKEDGDLDGALFAYRRAEQEIGDDADLQLNMGHLFKRMSRLGAALEAYRRSVDLAPTLLGGEALIQREQLLERFGWRETTEGVPGPIASLSELLNTIRAGEAEGQTVFRSYFRSFVMR